MMHSTEIEIAEGIGEVKFGMSPDEVLNILGEPNEKNKVEFSEEDPDYYSEEWHYDTIEMSLVFDMLESLELSTISVSSAQYTLEGESLIGMDYSSLMELFEEIGIENSWIEFEEEDPDSRSFYNENEGISLYFEEELLSEFQWEML
jgi:hypothetical protein